VALRTTNIYGRISISDEAVATVAGRAALDCYGVVELVSNRFIDILSDLFNRTNYGKGIRVNTDESRIMIDVNVMIKQGIPSDALKDSLKSTIVYNVEQFSGMRVKAVNINIVGYKV